MYPHGEIDIKNLKHGHISKVNGKCLKHYLEFLEHREESHDLVDPPISPWYELHDNKLHVMYIIVLIIFVL